MSRNYLHESKLREFIVWLVRERGWKTMPITRNPYELARLCKDGKTFSIYQRAATNRGDPIVHCSVPHNFNYLVHQFIQETKDG